jgi:hypothetical protein
VGEKNIALARLAAAIALLSTVAVHGQTARPSIARSAGSGSIRGRVLAAQIDTPLRNARIELEDVASRVVSTVLTDGLIRVSQRASRRVRHSGDDGATNAGGGG